VPAKLRTGSVRTATTESGRHAGLDPASTFEFDDSDLKKVNRGSGLG
jgi:hypothetical protein